MSKKKVKSTVQYGAKWVAKEMKLTYHTVGMKLRAAGVPKSGKMYDFGSKTAAERVIKKLKTA